MDECRRVALPSHRPAARAPISSRRLVGIHGARCSATAEDEGVESFRVVGDMWGLRLKVSAKQMIQLELGFERLIVPRFPVVALCAYDARKFSGVELLDALKDYDDTYKIPVGRTLA